MAGWLKALSPSLEGGSSNPGLELTSKGEVARLSARPLGCGVGYKGRTEGSGALLLPPCDDACGDGTAVSFWCIGPSNKPPVELVTRPAGFETDILDSDMIVTFLGPKLRMLKPQTPYSFQINESVIDGDWERRWRGEW